MSGQLALLPGEDWKDVIRRAHEEHGPFVGRVCLFSGGNDSTVLAHVCRGQYDQLAFIDTGTAVPGVREFVEDFAARMHKDLLVYESGDAFRRMVLGIGQGALGFPGPVQHNRAYNRLKERRLRELTRDLKAGHPRRSRVLMLSGIRRAESSRRGSRMPITREGSRVFVNPLIDWSNREMWEYREKHAIPQSDVAAILHRSGECNCGAFAAPGEREELQAWYPEWFEDNIASLEREAEAAGLQYCRWGHRGRDAPAGDAGPLCSDCQLRLVEWEEAA